MLRRTAPAVLATLVCALGLFGASAAPWIHATVSTTLEATTVDVRGSDAATAVTALGLVAAAAALASTLAGRVLRSVVGVIVSLAGVGAGLVTVGVLRDPATAARASVGSRTGVVGSGGQFDPTVWPWVACAAAAAMVVCGAWLVVVARNAKPRAARRYDRGALTGAAASGPERHADDRRDGRQPGAAAQPGGHADDIDAWDALTRGEDPTG